MNLNKDKIEVGNCYTYTLPQGAKTKFGFVVINKLNRKNGAKLLQCALVAIPEGTFTMETFKDGFLYTRQIPSGANKTTFRTGIFCYDFDELSLAVLDKFIYLGNIKLDREKFIVGSGSNAGPEFMFNADLKNIDIILQDFEKLPLNAFLKKDKP